MFLSALHARGETRVQDSSSILGRPPCLTLSIRQSSAQDTHDFEEPPRKPLSSLNRWSEIPLRSWFCMSGRFPTKPTQNICPSTYGTDGTWRPRGLRRGDLLGCWDSMLRVQLAQVCTRVARFASCSAALEMRWSLN